MSDSVIREHLTIKDLNCGNCPKHSIKAHPIRSGNIHMCGDDRIDDMAPSVTKERGCASHPLALQVLAGPVIEELEKEEKEQIGIYQSATTMNEEVYHQGIVFGIQRGATLLKEGVKKP